MRRNIRTELPVASGAQGFDPELRIKTRRSIGWMFGETVLEQAFSFLIFVLMARTLAKEELGTFAILFLLMDMGREVVRAGVFQHVAKEQCLTRTKLDTIFWLNLFLGVVVAAGMIALGEAGQAFFHAPMLATVAPAMALALFLSAIGNTAMALRLKEFGHRTMALRSLIAAIVGAVVALGGVAAGLGIWAFVAQRVVREGVISLFAWFSVSWRPGFTFSFREARADLQFARDVVATQLVGYLALRAQDLIIARFLGPLLLGSYRVAWRSAELLGPQLVSIFSIVSLQTFARLQHDRAALRSAYVSIVRHCSVLVVPAMIGYGASGTWLVPAIFGSNWQDAGRLAPILSMLMLPFIVTYFFQTAMVVLGQSAIQRRVAVGDLISGIAVGIAVAPLGLTAIAAAFVVRAYLILPLQIALLQRYGTIGFRDHFRAVAPAFVAAMVMAFAVVAMFEFARPTGLPAMFAICVVGAAVYALTLFAAFPSERRAFLELLRGEVTDSPPSVAELAPSARD